MHHHIKNFDAKNLQQQLASTKPPLMYLQPVGFFTTNKVFGIAAAVAFAAAVLAASFWTAPPEQPATAVVKNIPALARLPVAAVQRNDSSALLSSLPAAAASGAGAGANKNLHEIDFLNGAELATAFNKLYERAQAGDSEMAHALASRLRTCNSSQRLEQQKLAATIEIVGTPNWAQTLDESWRRRCIGLSVVQLDKAAALQALAVKQNYAPALLENANQTLSALELAKEAAVDAEQPTTQTPQQTESLNASIRTLDALTQAGNYGALNTLVGLYAKGSIVDADAEKFLAYQLVAQHDWAQSAQSMAKSPLLLAEEDTDIQQKALKQATTLFNSCCVNKEKTR